MQDQNKDQDQEEKEDKIISAEEIAKILDELVDEMGLGKENND